MTMHGTQGKEHGDPAQGAQAQQPLQPGQEGTPPGQEGTPEIIEEKQYGGAEVKQLIRKALSADGRKQQSRAETSEASLRLLAGEHETLKGQFTTISSQVTTLLKATEDSELAKLSEDKPAQDQLRVRQENRREAIRLEGVDTEAKRKLALAETKSTEADGKLVTANIKLAAMAAGVDEKALTDLVPDGNAGRLANAANLLKQSITVEIDPATGKPKPAALTITPASAISAGGEARSVSEKMLQEAKEKK